MGEYDERDVPEEANPSALLNSPAVWSWTPARIAYVAAGIVGTGFIVWFLMDFNAAKRAHLAKAVTGE